MRALHPHTLSAIAALALLAAAPSQATVTIDPPIHVSIYSTFTETLGTGIRFDNLVAELGANDIQFGLPDNWWPLGNGNAFGALLTGGLQAGSAGSYTLTLGSDDAAYLFIDQQLVLALPDAHAYFTRDVTVPLAPGYHALELQFYNSFCCGSVLTLNPGGLEYVAAVPEPASLPLWLGGLAVAGWQARRRLLPV